MTVKGKALINKGAALTTISGQFSTQTPDLKRRLRANTEIDLNKAQPKIKAQGSLENIQTQGLLADLTGPTALKLTGKGNLQFQITTLGNSGPGLLQNLNGSGKLNLVNGSLSGLDMLYLVFTAYALINQQPPPAKSSNTTPFSNLSASFLLRNGVLSNHDLKLTTPLLLAKGSGSLDATPLTKTSAGFHNEA